MPIKSSFLGPQDVTDPANLCPISNLNTTSKMLDKLVAARYRPYLMSLTNFFPTQSAYRRGHSMKITLLKILDDAFSAAENRQATALVSLDISSVGHCGPFQIQR
jgi:hypothetical protein